MILVAETLTDWDEKETVQIPTVPQTGHQQKKMSNTCNLSFMKRKYNWKVKTVWGETALTPRPGISGKENLPMVCQGPCKPTHSNMLCSFWKRTTGIFYLFCHCILVALKLEYPVSHFMELQLRYYIWETVCKVLSPRNTTPHADQI